MQHPLKRELNKNAELYSDLALKGTSHLSYIPNQFLVEIKIGDGKFIC